MTDDDRVFEDEVRRIARMLWPGASHGGASIEAGRERDGVFEEEDAIHLIECTTSRRKDKAVQDVSKLDTLIEDFRRRHPRKAVLGWFVTRDEPEAEQRNVAKSARNQINALSLDQFRHKLIDAHSYLSARENYPFGSARDPDTGSATDRTEYVPIELNIESETDPWNVRRLAKEAANGSRLVLLGDYGAGKSSTLREVFRELAGDYRRGRLTQFPVFLNLRDHHGQRDTAEALERHARAVGYGSSYHLVRAWRAGYVIMLLDGFDEIATPGWTGQVKELRTLRYRAMELLRKFVKETPAERGLVLSGRGTFFDSDAEMHEALDLNPSWRGLRLNDFTKQQLQKFAARRGWTGMVPDWFPTRPLLIAYLTSRGLLAEILDLAAGSGPAAGWDVLLDRVCAREAQIEAGISGPVVRRVLERLATRARREYDGLGRLAQEELVGTFTEICGHPPDDVGMVLLQRLPGLGARASDDGSRSFVDTDLADAYRAGDVFSFIKDPYDAQLGDPFVWQIGLGSLGTGVSSLKCRRAGLGTGTIGAALRKASQERWPVLTADVLDILLEQGEDYSGPRIFVKDAVIELLSIGEGSPNLAEIEFQSCIFKTFEVTDPLDLARAPRFLDCLIQRVEGRVGPKDMPLDRFTDCSFEEFSESTITTSSILQTSLPKSVRAALTVLRKLYLQRGSGRRASALIRGVDPGSRALIPQVLTILEQEGMTYRTRVGGQDVWHPVRSQAARANNVLAGPSTSSDALLDAARQIS
jgi:hypothetical protein